MILIVKFTSEYLMSSLYIDCMAGGVRLIGGSSYYGIAQYCYQEEDNTIGEWISLCSMPWNTRLSQLVCRQITNSFAPIDGIVNVCMHVDEYYHKSSNCHI